MTERFMTPAEMRDYARRHTLTAMRTVVDLCQNGRKEATRLAAAKELLDRGWGRSIQAITYDPTDANSNLLTILQGSYTAAIEQLDAPQMIERVENEDPDELLQLAKSSRPKLKKQD